MRALLPSFRSCWLPLAGLLLLLPAGAQNSQPGAAPLQQLIDEGHADEALKQLDAQPPAPGRDRMRGQAFYALDRFQDADRAFVAAIAADPHDEESAQMRGLTLFRLGHPAEAIPLLEHSHQWGANTKVDPSYVLALCYLDTRRYDDARHAFALQYGFPGDSAPAYLLAARMFLRREFVPIAQASAEKALAIDPQLPLAHALLGEVALAGNHTDEAIAQFEAERARNPLAPSVYDRLGDAYLRAANYPMAQQILERAVLLEPNATGPYILLGKVLLKRQAPVTASMYLERAEKMDPTNTMTHSLLGQAYRALGRTDDAARETEAVQKLQAKSEPRLDGSK
jgi:predicted Zn-dependent protease